MAEMVERLVAVLDQQLDDFPEIGASRLPVIVRAILAAQREPTPEMLTVGDRAAHFGPRYAAIDAWQAMIDAALSPPADRDRG